jgi:hypothetical protein
MKQVTAVEWFNQQLVDRQNGDGDSRSWDEILEQAKEMEKQQIIEAGNSCAIKQHLHNERIDKMSMDEMLDFSNTQTVTFGEQYFNETFNKK